MRKQAVGVEFWSCELGKLGDGLLVREILLETRADGGDAVEQVVEAFVDLGMLVLVKVRCVRATYIMSCLCRLLQTAAILGC